MMIASNENFIDVPKKNSLPYSVSKKNAQKIDSRKSTSTIFKMISKKNVTYTGKKIAEKRHTPFAIILNVLSLPILIH